MPISQTLANQLLRKHYKGTNYTPPSTWWLALLTAVATKVGGGTEVALAGYARKQITWGTEANSELVNINTMTFTVSSGSALVVAHKIMDAQTGAGTGWHHFGQLDVAWNLTSSRPLVVRPGDLHVLL